MSKKTSADYWRKREEAWAKEYRQNEERWQRQIWTIYKNLKEDMQAEIDAWYQRFAKAEGITMVEAKRRVSRSDQDYYARRAKQLVDMAQKDIANETSANAQLYFSANANSDMRIYNTTMKVDRMQLLQAMLDIQIDIAAGKIDETMAQALTEQAEKTYLNQAKILGETVIQNMERIPELVNASFHGATFSQRIWGAHQQKLKDDMQRILSRGLILGEHPDRFRKLIVSQTDLKTRSAYKAAGRLLNTEFARVQTTAQLNSIQTAGFDQFMFITSAGCCHKCQDNNGKTFDIKGSMSGDNLPPMHPNCRCSIAAYSDREEYEKWLDEFAENGTEWEEWKDELRRSYAEKGISGQLGPWGTNKVDKGYIQSADYRKKFTRMTENSKVNDAIRKFFTGVLTKYSGTDTEVMQIIDANTGETIIRKAGDDEKLGVSLTKEEVDLLRNYKGQMIGMHNHPTNLLPTGSDFVASGFRGYSFGVVGTHDGRVFKYSHGDDPIHPSTIDRTLETACSLCKTEKEERTLCEQALKQLCSDWGLLCEER